MKKEKQDTSPKVEKKESLKDKLLYEFGEIVEGVSHELDDRLEMVETYAEDEVEIVKSKVKKNNSQLTD